MVAFQYSLIIHKTRKYGMNAGVSSVIIASIAKPLHKVKMKFSLESGERRTDALGIGSEAETHREHMADQFIIQ